MNDDAIPPRGRVTLERYEDVWILSLRGEHDIATAGYVRELLADCRVAGGDVCIDLTAATFIDSSILATLYDAFQAEVPPRVRIVAPADTPPRRLFDFVGLGDALPIYETLEAARVDAQLGQ
jgi:anti-sigma B factor antagonist